MLYIHGGGWQGGDKNSVGAAAVKHYLDNEISVAAINYRYVRQAAEGLLRNARASLIRCR